MDSADKEAAEQQQQQQDSKIVILTAKTCGDFVPQSVVEGENRLQYSYAVWFTQRIRGNSVSSTPSDYEDNIKLIGSFSSVEQFWGHYCHLAKPCELPSHCDIHLFKHGIKPMWEDEANRNGGKWMVRLKKGIASRCWENLLLAIIGEQFIVGNEICGAVISVRGNEDIISLWNRTASDPTITIGIRDTMTRVMSLPKNTVLEYKTHNTSLKDKSSFRNTDVFVR